jgi:hypothetical protein
MTAKPFVLPILTTVLGRRSMTKRAMAALVITGLAGGCAQGNTQSAQDINTAEAVIVLAPIWVPAVLFCAAVGCKKESEKEKKEKDAVAAASSTEKNEAIRSAAEKGDADAQFELGVIYESNGQYGTAVMWYRKSAEQRNMNAELRLGVLYEIGNGLEKDYVQADARYIAVGSAEKAPPMTAAVANAWRDSIESRMTPEQIAEARKRSAEWKPGPSTPSPVTPSDATRETSGNGANLSNGIAP